MSTDAPVCPRCGTTLKRDAAQNEWLCPTHDRFALVDGVPHNLPAREYAPPDRTDP